MFLILLTLFIILLLNFTLGLRFETVMSVATLKLDKNIFMLTRKVYSCNIRQIARQLEKKKTLAIQQTYHAQ